MARYVGTDLGEPDGAIVFDRSAFARKGIKGVARRWCDHLGKVENCQIGVYMADVSRKVRALVNTRLYLPKEGAKHKVRRMLAGEPVGMKLNTCHQLGLEVLDRHFESR